MTNPISPAGNSTIPLGDSSTSTSASQEGGGTASLLQPDTFLDLLVDQLKYQNPLNPTSSSTFMSQVAELSQVEQLQTVSSATQMGEAASLIGLPVTGAGPDGEPVSGTVTGVTNTTNGPALDVDGESLGLSEVDEIG
jgi:flagellar basal-body rod modification protein FlgD